MQKNMSVTVNIDVARMMLRLAGYKVDDKTNDEIFTMAINTADCYGVTYEEVEIHTAETKE